MFSSFAACPNRRQAPVPEWVLQPFVENHGLYYSETTAMDRFSSLSEK
jgi:hypothetical protein